MATTAPSRGSERSGRRAGPATATVRRPQGRVCTRHSPLTPSGSGPGAVVETQFKVESINRRDGVQLNSLSSPTEKGNFAVHILPSAIEKAGKTEKKVAAEFEGKTIRVRGRLAKDLKSETAWIEATALEQILDVSAPR